MLRPDDDHPIEPCQQCGASMVMIKPERRYCSLSCADAYRRRSNDASPSRLAERLAGLERRIALLEVRSV